LLEHTLEVLDYQKIINQVKSMAQTNIGKEIIAKLKPVDNKEYIEERLAEVTAAKEMYLETGRPPFGGARDIRKNLNKAEKGITLTTDSIVDVANTLRAVQELKTYFNEIEANFDQRVITERYEILFEIANQLVAIPEVKREINRCINDYGEVADNASSRLKSLRKQIETIENRIREKLESIIKDSNYQTILQDSLITRRENRYVVPVKQQHKNNFNGIVHGQSASGMTVFMEPMAVVKMNNELREVKANEAAEVQRILQRLTALIAKHVPQLKNNLKLISRLDVIFAEAIFSDKISGTAPELNENNYIDIKQGRHPLLNNDPVPIDIKVGNDFSTLVITGPNTGGKTVSLKTVGLFVLMAQTGLHIPADIGTTLPVLEQVFADIGDEQSIEQNLSTFSSHMHRIRNFLDKADGRTLVLLDELGVGTDPEEGAALGIAVLEKLQETGSLSISTTHYSQLKSYAYATENVENASVEFDIETLRPTYRLIMGIPGGSNAFAIALKLGLPEEIIDRAKELLSEEEIKVEEIIGELNSERKKYHELRVEMENYHREEKRLKEKYENMLAEQKEKEKNMIKKAQVEAEDIVASARKKAKRLLGELKQKNYDSRSEVDRMENQVNQEIKKIEEQFTVAKEKEVIVNDEDIKAGDKVRVKSIGRKGEVLTIDENKHEAVVRAGIMKVTVDLNDIILIDQPEQQQEQMVKKYKVTKSENISPKIDLRGERYESAQHQLDKYLDDAFLAGLKELEIIHGKGSGALRDAVQEILDKNPHITDYRLGHQSEGGTGVTIAQLH